MVINEKLRQQIKKDCKYYSSKPIEYSVTYLINKIGKLINTETMSNNSPITVTYRHPKAWIKYKQIKTILNIHNHPNREIIKPSKVDKEEHKKQSQYFNSPKNKHKITLKHALFSPDKLIYYNENELE